MMTIWNTMSDEQRVEAEPWPYLSIEGNQPGEIAPPPPPTKINEKNLKAALGNSMMFINLSDVQPNAPDLSTFNSWKDSSEFAVWVDGSVVKNSELDNFSFGEIVHFNSSRIYKNARSESFPQPYQVNLYTQDGFQNAFRKDQQ
jgi:hypothetical protein